MEKTLKKNIKVLAKQKSCYGCSKSVTEGQNTKICTLRLTCSSCKGKHPTPLYGYTPNNKSKMDERGNLTKNLLVSTRT